jgi:hypothetical protein
LALGPGAAVWLKEAAAIGTERIIQKMAHAVELSARAAAPMWTGRWVMPRPMAASLPAISIPSWPARAWIPPVVAPRRMLPWPGHQSWNLLGTNIVDTPDAGIA